MGEAVVGDHHPQPSAPQPALAMHWDGARFTVTNVPIVNPETGCYGGNPLNDISAIAPNDIWAAGEYWATNGIFPLLLHWDGNSWSEQPNPGGFGDMVALARDDIWAVGGDAVYRYNDTSWTVAATFPQFPDVRLVSISGTTACGLWATGQEDINTLVVRGGTGADNLPPTAAFTFTCTDLSCAFDGSGSSDADGDIVSYNWNFGDSATATGIKTAHSFLQASTYAVRLSVVENGGARGSVVKDVALTTPAAANLQIAKLKAPAVAASRQTISVSDVTANVGTAPAASSITQVWVSSDKLLGNDVALGAGGRSVGVLPAGTSSSGSISAVLPAVARALTT